MKQKTAKILYLLVVEKIDIFYERVTQLSLQVICPSHSWTSHSNQVIAMVCSVLCKASVCHLVKANEKWKIYQLDAYHVCQK